MINKRITYADIRLRIDISDIIGAVIEIDRYGKGLCPFHNDRNPSLYIDEKRQRFKCFGCGISGDCFDFVKLHYGLDRKSAFKLLAQRAGYNISGNIPEAARKEIKERRLERERERRFLEWCEFWRDRIAEVIRKTDSLNDDLTTKNIDKLGTLAITHRAKLDYWWSILAHGSLEERVLLYREKRRVWGVIEW